MEIVSNKQKFLTPAISRQETRKRYEKAAESYNSQFFDETGKFINAGSRKLTFNHKEIFMGMVALMDFRLKVYNFSNKYPEARNFITKPFMFSMTIQDLKNMIMQNEDDKKTSSTKSLKDYLYRLTDAGMLQTFQWRREKMKYDVQIDPKLTAFRELATERANDCESVDKKNKKTDCCFYTIYNTSIINNKTNLSDFNRRENLHANFSSDKINFKKNRGDGNAPAPVDGESQIDLIISDQKIEKITDNRTVNEKKTEKDRVAAEIFDASATADEKMNSEIRNRINKMLYPVRKTPVFSPAELKRDHDFYNFKKNIIVNFYVFFLNVIFQDKAKLYGPRDFDSPYRIFVLQSIQELVTNPKYFGKCLTIQQFEHQSKFLQNVVMNVKNRWMKAHPNFNWDYVSPNVYLSGGYKHLKFEKTVDYFIGKNIEKAKNYEYVRAEKKFSDKQFNSSIRIVEKIINMKSNFGLHMTDLFKQHCRVYLDKENKMRIRSEQTHDNFRYMQNFIKIYNVNYKLNH